MKDYSKYSDIELVTLLKEDNPISDNAFSIIYMKYSSQIYGYCSYHSETREEAEELMQDTWLKFHAYIKAGKKTNKILPLLFTIARNLSIDRYRNNTSTRKADIRNFDLSLMEQYADPFNFLSDMESGELANLVRIAVDSLEEIYRETLVLYWFGGFKYSEIAEVLGETESCIRTRIERGFRQLASLLKSYFIDLKN